MKTENDQSFSRSKTRRGLDDTTNNDDKQESSTNKNQANTDVWRPSSSLNKKDPVDPLVGLDDLQSQTGRSNDERNPSADPFKDWYPKTSDDENDD